jgi:hypothetical protein
MLQENPGLQSQFMLPATDQNATTAVRPMLEKETESVFRKQLKELWNV